MCSGDDRFPAQKVGCLIGFQRTQPVRGRCVKRVGDVRLFFHEPGIHLETVQPVAEVHELAPAYPAVRMAPAASSPSQKSPAPCGTLLCAMLWRSAGGVRDAVPFMKVAVPATRMSDCC